MPDVVQKLWGFCNTLRHDGIGYGDYIEQLTYLLFLKLADEKSVKVPKNCSWGYLKKLSGTNLTDQYIEILKKLAKEKGFLGDIFAGSLSKFREPVNLKKLISLIDETKWSELDVDLKADAYEGLLQKYAAEQKGAGQYFTPREAIRAIVRCMKPDIRENPEFNLHDPAMGTAGFLIGSFEWMMKETNQGAKLTRADRQRLLTKTFSGMEIVQETRRLGLMNLYLHDVETQVFYGDSLADGPHANRHYTCVLTNPPFGTKGGGEAPNRDDFTVKTSNKQLNFIQHVMHILKLGGRAAMVLPDNVLFEDHAGKEVRQIWMQDCDLHTILRLPIGTFTPYSPGVKANVAFFRKAKPTEEVWIFDLRTNVEKVTKGKPLTANYFKEFEESYGKDPNGHPKGGRKESERFHRFTRHEIVKRDDNLDIFWLKDENLDDSENLAEPEDLITTAVDELQSAVDQLNDVMLLLQNGNGKQKKQNR